MTNARRSLSHQIPIRHTDPSLIACRQVQTSATSRPFHRGEHVGDTDNINIKKALREALTPLAALNIIQTDLIAKISRHLSIPANEISDSQAFVELGGDSLVAAELRNWIAKELDAKVQIFEVTRKHPIRVIVALLAARLKIFDQC